MSPVNAGANSSEDPGVHSRCSLGNGVLSVGVVRRLGELLGLAGDAVFRRVDGEDHHDRSFQRIIIQSIKAESQRALKLITINQAEYNAGVQLQALTGPSLGPGRALHILPSFSFRLFFLFIFPP